MTCFDRYTGQRAQAVIRASVGLRARHMPSFLPLKRRTCSAGRSDFADRISGGDAERARKPACMVQVISRRSDTERSVRASKWKLKRYSGGEGGIRTHGTRKGSTVFETARFNHSRTSPNPHSTGFPNHFQRVSPAGNVPLSRNGIRRSCTASLSDTLSRRESSLMSMRVAGMAAPGDDASTPEKRGARGAALIDMERFVDLSRASQRFARGLIEVTGVELEQSGARIFPAQSFERFNNVQSDETASWRTRLDSTVSTCRPSSTFRSATCMEARRLAFSLARIRRRRGIGKPRGTRESAIETSACRA